MKKYLNYCAVPFFRAYAAWVKRRDEQTMAKFFNGEVAKIDQTSLSNIHKAACKALLSNHKIMYSEMPGTAPGTPLSQRQLYIQAANKVHCKIMALSPIVGIQPMDAPVSMGYALRIREISNNSELPTLIGLQVTPMPTAAKTFKINSTMAIEPIINKLTATTIDSETLLDIWASSIAAEYASQVITSIVKVTTDNNNVITPTVDNVDQLCGIILNQCNEIGSKCRRGNGSVIVVSPETGLTLMQSSLVTPVFEPSNEVLRRIGSIIVGGSVRVEIYESLSMDAGTILVGYKGEIGDTDFGVIVSPYQITMSSTLDPDTFEPHICARARYGSNINDSSISSEQTAEAANYYSVIKYTLSPDIVDAPVSTE